jgi:hypothetical protein
VQSHQEETRSSLGENEAGGESSVTVEPGPTFATLPDDADMERGERIERNEGEDHGTPPPLNGDAEHEATVRAQHGTAEFIEHEVLPRGELIAPELTGRGEEESKEEISDRPPEPPPYPYAAATTIMAATQEATVLEEELPNDPAVLAAMEEEQLLLALKRSAYDRGGKSSRQTDINYGDHQEATVVEIAHETFMNARDVDQFASSGSAVQAEFMGEDYSRPASSLQMDSQPRTEVSGQYATETTEEENATTEATVIDSAPLEKEREAWNLTEEAQVLEDDKSTPLMDTKPAAADDPQDPRNRDDYETFAVADQEAEVLAIQEEGEYHPSERNTDNAEAEFVGTDDSYGNALASSHPQTSGAVPSTGVRDDECHEETQSLAAAVTTAAAASAAAVATNVNNAALLGLASVPTREAHVLLQDEGDWMDRKPPAVDRPPRRRDAGQEVEVLGIRDDADIHPEERMSSDAEAELVGTDDFYCPAVQTTTSAVEGSETPEASAVMPENSPLAALPERELQASKVQATLVEIDVHSTTPPTTSAAAFADPQEMNNPFLENNFPDDYQAGLEALDEQCDETWMRSPAFGGDSSTPPPPVAVDQPRSQEAAAASCDNAEVAEDPDTAWLRETPAPRPMSSSRNEVSDGSGVSRNTSDTTSPRLRLGRTLANIEVVSCAIVADLSAVGCRTLTHATSFRCRIISLIAPWVSWRPSLVTTLVDDLERLLTRQ